MAPLLLAHAAGCRQSTTRRRVLELVVRVLVGQKSDPDLSATAVAAGHRILAMQGWAAALLRVAGVLPSTVTVLTQAAAAGIGMEQGECDGEGNLRTASLVAKELGRCAAAAAGGWRFVRELLLAVTSVLLSTTGGSGPCAERSEAILRMEAEDYVFVSENAAAAVLGCWAEQDTVATAMVGGMLAELRLVRSPGGGDEISQCPPKSQFSPSSSTPPHCLASSIQSTHARRRTQTVTLSFLPAHRKCLYGFLYDSYLLPLHCSLQVFEAAATASNDDGSKPVVTTVVASANLRGLTAVLHGFMSARMAGGRDDRLMASASWAGLVRIHPDTLSSKHSSEQMQLN